METKFKNLQNKIYLMSNSFLPLDMFFNDIRDNKAENYDKEMAYKDLEIIADFILDLQQQLDEKDKEIENMKQVILNWQIRNRELSVEKVNAIIDYDKLIRNIDKFANKQLAIQELEKVEELILKIDNNHKEIKTLKNGYSTLYVDSPTVISIIDQEIKELKGE